jgi:hypothetical protein
MQMPPALRLHARVIINFEQRVCGSRAFFIRPSGWLDARGGIVERKKASLDTYKYLLSSSLCCWLKETVFDNGHYRIWQGGPKQFAQIIGHWPDFDGFIKYGK